MSQTAVTGVNTMVSEGLSTEALKSLFGSSMNDFSPVPQRQRWVVAQELIITVDGNKYTGWINTKREPDADSETGGKRFELLCDLNVTPKFGAHDQGVCRLVEK